MQQVTEPWKTASGRLVAGHRDRGAAVTGADRWIGVGELA